MKVFILIQVIFISNDAYFMAATTGFNNVSFRIYTVIQSALTNDIRSGYRFVFIW